jgi:hypothetical protein
MFEHYRQPLIPLNQFVHRIFRGVSVLLALLTFSVVVGTVGYRETEDMTWVDAFYNATLIMSGMGPAKELATDTGKIFASFYSLYSGLFLVAATGLLLMPFFHRMLHHMHRDLSDQKI